jgi:hypothetical protein
MAETIPAIYEEGMSPDEEAVTKAISEWFGLSKKKKKSIIEIRPEHFGKCG